MARAAAFVLLAAGALIIDIPFALIQEELQQKKQITDGTEILLTADNLQQYVKKIEVDRRKSTYTEFVF